MFIYDAWDENLYRSMLRRSWDLKRARGKSAGIVGGEQVADATLMGTYMGLYKQALVEDENPGDHLPSEAARRILTQVFQHPGWAELRAETVGDRFLSALGASAIMETVTQIIEEQNREKREKAGRGRKSRSNKDIPSMDKIEQAEQAKEKAHEDAETIEAITEIEQGATTQRERNAAEAAKRQLTARKEMNERRAGEAEAQSEQALADLEQGLADPELSRRMKRQAEHLKAVKDSLDDLVEAGVLDENTEDLVADDLDTLGDDDWLEGDDEGDGEGHDPDEELDEDEINALFGGRQGGQWGKQLAGMSAAAVARVRAASDALKATKGLAEVAAEAGRIKAVFRSAMKPTMIAGNPGAIEGVSYGNKISAMTSGSMALLALPKARRAWRLGFIEESLPEREMWGPDLAGRGPIVLAVDCSSSMGGSKFFWAKALGIALLSIAKEQERDFAWISFNHEVAYSVVIPQGKADVSALVGIEQQGATGGTRFAPWMQAAVEIIGQRSAFAKADVIVISDGEPSEHVYADERAAENLAARVRQVEEYRRHYNYPQAWCDQQIEEARITYGLYQWWKEERQRLGFRVRGVYIADTHRSLPAGSEAAVAALTTRIAQAEGEAGSSMPTWVRHQIQRDVAIRAAVEAEIRGGVEITGSPTVEQIQATYEWHGKQFIQLSGDADAVQRQREAHNERVASLSRIQGPARVMAATADTWSDVSQITDKEATAAVEAEIARMVE